MREISGRQGARASTARHRIMAKPAVYLAFRAVPASAVRGRGLAVFG